MKPYIKQTIIEDSWSFWDAFNLFQNKVTFFTLPSYLEPLKSIYNDRYGFFFVSLENPFKSKDIIKRKVYNI